tara:strand:+ start:104 stop:1000 length:897 start_codon:yes stop_codon:yes gene_type:complete
MKNVNCLLCKSDKSHLISKIGRDSTNLKIVICKSCGFLYLNPRYTKEEYKSMYSSGSYSKKYRSNNEISEKYVNNQRRKGKSINDFIASIDHKKGGTCFEVGSTSGGILEYFKNIGYKHVEGIDPEVAYVNYANEVLNVKTHIGLFDDFKTKNKYSLIILRHVLEHTVDPIKILRGVKKMLAPGGLVYVEVPNLYSLNLMNDWIFNFIIEHIYIFTPNTLKIAVHRAGLNIVKEDNNVGFKRDIRFILKDNMSENDKVPKGDNWIYILYRGWMYHYLTPIRKLYYFVRLSIKKIIQEK